MPPKKINKKLKKKPVIKEEDEDDDELSETSDVVMRRDDVDEDGNKGDGDSDEDKTTRLLNRVEAESDEDDDLDEDIDEVEEEEEEQEEEEDYEDKNEFEEGSDDDNEFVDVVDKDKCVYNLIDYGYASDKSENSEDMVADVVFDDEDDGVEDTNNTVKDEDRITKAVMTKYERVRIIGDRANQLSLGAKSMIKNSEHLSSKEIAELELEYNIIPIIIIRPLPNGKQEKWRIKDLEH